MILSEQISSLHRYGFHTPFCCGLSFFRVLRPMRDTNKKPPCGGFFVCGGRAGTRTLDPLIKSQLLYQLSYASRTVKLWQLYIFLPHLQAFIASANVMTGCMPWSPCGFQNVIVACQPCPSYQLFRFFVQLTHVRHDEPT